MVELAQPIALVIRHLPPAAHTYPALVNRSRRNTYKAGDFRSGTCRTLGSTVRGSAMWSLTEIRRRSDLPSMDHCLREAGAGGSNPLTPTTRAQLVVNAGPGSEHADRGSNHL
jgi:hypothetical protein